jgi:protease IV
MNSLIRIAIFSLCCFLFSGCMFVNIPLQIPPSDYQEVQIEKGSHDKILILDIDGVITSGTSESQPFFFDSNSTVNEIAEKLAKAKKDKSIKAVILRIDSPGGGVTASDVIYKMILDYKEETGIPIYCSMLDVAASGGYYIAMTADKIYAHPTTVTGSIGVISMFPQLAGLGDKIGIHVETIKSGKYKDMGSPFNEMPPSHREVLQSIIDDMYGNFLDVVVQGRPNLDKETIRQLADGRAYTARQAKEAGLVDEIKYLNEVIKEVKETNGITQSKVVIYRKSSKNNIESIYAKATPLVDTPYASSSDTNIGLINFNGAGMMFSSRPGFYYLWMP